MPSENKCFLIEINKIVSSELTQAGIPERSGAPFGICFHAVNCFIPYVNTNLYQLAHLTTVRDVDIASRLFRGLVFGVVQSNQIRTMASLCANNAVVPKFIKLHQTSGAYQRTQTEYIVMAWYAYCIGEKQAFPEIARHRKPVPMESVLGVSGNQVFLYPASDLAVIVSEHNPAETLNQKSGVDHARVIADCFQHSTVLPFRFGTASPTTKACASPSAPTSGSSWATLTSCEARPRCI